jgi:hypothetical protein
MKLSSREDQVRVLTALAEMYPQEADVERLATELSSDVEQLQRMLHLLVENGLIDAQHATFSHHMFDHWDMPRINARGLAFLDADGGLGKQLGRVTVEFDAEVLRSLMLQQVESSALAATEKSRLKTALSIAGTEALKTLTKALVEGALQRWPDAIRLVQTLPG